MRKLVGQGRLKEIFRSLIVKDKLPHALLFYGPEGVGKDAAALELGKYLLCQGDNPPCDSCSYCRKFDKYEHPDFFHLFPIQSPKGDYEKWRWEEAMSEEQVDNYHQEVQKKAQNYYHQMNMKGAQNILIGQVRDLIHKSSFSSFSGDNRFALISPAHLMNKEAQNSLLKLLEEPPAGFYICLATPRPEALLPTVISRCQPFYFPILSKEEIAKGLMDLKNAEAEKAQFIAGRADGSYSRAVDILENRESLRDTVLNKILADIVKRNPINIFKAHKNFQMNRPYSDKPTAKRILIEIDHWLRDVDMMDHGLEPRYNRDLRQRLEKFRKNVDYKDIPRMRRVLAESVDLIDKNVYIDMIYINLANRLNRLMKKKDS